MPVLACLNEYATSIDGTGKVINLMPTPAYHNLAVREPDGGWEKRRKELEADSSFAIDPKKRNDYAVALVHLGRNAEAISVFEGLEKQTPGDYIIAANLGTAYELAGKNELALQWIREGIRRNPASHEGTEWLHVRILQAKLALAKDSSWLQTHSILDGGPGLTGDETVPTAARIVMDDIDGKHDSGGITESIWYQLRERVQFVKPKDPIVAELLLELASLTALSETVEKALPLLKLAGDYGPARASLYTARKQHFEALVRANPKSGKRTDEGDRLNFIMLVCATVLVSGLALYVLYRLLRFGYLRLRAKRLSG
jgi:tetratricopeptide (TPR) repeat protein